MLISIGGSAFSGKSTLARQLSDRLYRQYEIVQLMKSGKISEYGVFDSFFFKSDGLIKKVFQETAKAINPTISHIVSIIKEINNRSLLVGEQQIKIYDELSSRRKDRDLLIICDDYDSWDECSKKVILSYLKHKKEGVIHTNNFNLIVILISENEIKETVDVEKKAFKLEPYCAQNEDDFRKYVEYKHISNAIVSRLYKLSSGNLGFSKHLLELIYLFPKNNQQDLINFPLPNMEELIVPEELARWFVRFICSRYENMSTSLGVLASFSGAVHNNLLFSLVNTFFRFERTGSDFLISLRFNILKAIEISILKRENESIYFCDFDCKKASYEDITQIYKETMIEWHKYVADFLIKNYCDNSYEIYWHLKHANMANLANQYYCVYCIEMAQKGEEDSNRLCVLGQGYLREIYNAIRNNDLNSLCSVDLDMLCPRLRIEINYALMLGYYREKPKEKSSEIIETCESYMNEPAIHFKFRFRFAWLLMFLYINRLDDLNLGRKIYRRICTICDGTQLNERDETDIKAKLARVSSAFLSQEMTYQRLHKLWVSEELSRSSIKNKVMLLTNLSGCEIAIGKYEDGYRHSRDALEYLKRSPWYGSFKVINNYCVSYFLKSEKDSKKDILNEISELFELSNCSLLFKMNIVCMQEIVEPSSFDDMLFPIRQEQKIDDYCRALIYYNRITHAILNRIWSKADEDLKHVKSLVPSICYRDQAYIKSRWNFFNDIVCKRIEFLTYDSLRTYIIDKMGATCLWSEPYIISDLQYWSEL